MDDGVGALVGVALAAASMGLLGSVIALGIQWLLELPLDVLARLGAIVGLLAGSALVYLALLHLERHVHPSPDPSRGRRPVNGDNREARRFGHASGLPPIRVDVAHGPTAPPPAGGRALPRPNGRYPCPDAGLIEEDFDRLRARGMGRKRSGFPGDTA